MRLHPLLVAVPVPTMQPMEAAEGLLVESSLPEVAWQAVGRGCVPRPLPLAVVWRHMCEMFGSLHPVDCFGVPPECGLQRLGACCGLALAPLVVVCAWSRLAA